MGFYLSYSLSTEILIDLEENNSLLLQGDIITRKRLNRFRPVVSEVSVLRVTLY